MAVSVTRDQFKARCLRRLGDGVLEINVTEEQIDDAVDDALQFWWDYHCDGTEKTYYKHVITANNVTSKSITVPENVIGVVKIFPVGDSLNTANMFSIRYQIALNDLYTLTTQSMAPYYMSVQHVQMLDQILVGEQSIRYNRHRNVMHLDMDWSRLDVGSYLVVEAYEVIDPTTYTDVWKDRWLLQYCTVLIKKMWGNHLRKFGGMVLIGGLQFNGQQIYDEAQTEQIKMEDEMILNLSLPVSDLIG